MNSEETIGKCLESIARQGCKKEIIVVDGGSRDRTQDIIKKRRAKLLIEKKKGPAAARNRGLDASKGDMIAFIDADVILPEGWARKALKLLGSDKKIAGVGGPGISAEGGVIPEALDCLLYGKSKNVKKKYVDSLATMDVLYRKPAIAKQRFDESFITAEDPEFNFRLVKKGYKLLYSRELFVHHHHPLTLKSLLKRWYNYGKNYARPYLRHKEIRNPGFYARILYMPLLIIFLLASVIYTITAYAALMQILLLFFAYLCIGLRACRGKAMLLFPFLHTMKQIAHMVGIFVYMIKG